MKKCILGLLVMSIASLFAASKIDSAARWLWYPEPFSSATNDVERYGRIVFECGAENVEARLFYFTDDHGGAYINGMSVGVDRELKGFNGPAFRVGDMLRKGKNVLCIRVHNGGGPGAMIGHLEIKGANGYAQDVVTNADWKISKTPDEGWTKLDFDDSKWVNAKDLGNTIVPPWTNIYDFRMIYTDAERAIYDAEKAAIQKEYDAIIARIEKEPETTVKLDVQVGRKPQIVINGKPYNALIYNSPYPWPYEQEKTIEKIHHFASCGMHVYSLGADVPHFWKSKDEINLKMYEERILKLLRLDPDAYVNIVINTTSAPGWWIEANPDEMVDYANGGIQPGATDPIQRVRQPSMGSDKWLADFTGLISKVVSHIESLPIGKRVFSYRIDNGVYREWHYFGMDSGMPDTGKAMTAQFRAWLKRKYPTDAALQAAWGRTDVTLDTAAVPGVEARKKTVANGKVLRDPVESREALDFLHCFQERIRDFMMTCDRTAKEASGYRKLCGNYYGYFFGMPYPVEGWHLENDVILASNVVDYEVSPNLYGYRKMDEAEFGRSLVESFTLRGKLHIQEHDTRTSLSVDDPGHTHVKSIEESVAALSRDFAQTLIRNTGCWFLDFSKNWYNDPQIFNMFSQFIPILKLAEENKSAAEVAFVGDLESIYYHRVVKTGYCLTIDATARELTHCGTPFETIAFTDLNNPKVRDYKVYIFPNLYYVTPEKLAVIERLRKAGKTIVWLYAPGYLHPDGHNADYIRQLTGFTVAESTERADGKSVLANGINQVPLSSYTTCPSFTIETPDATPLAYRGGDKSKVVLARRPMGASMQYYASNGFISADGYKQIFAEAGVHCYEKSGNCILWANDSFLSVSGMPGKFTISLPEPRPVTQLLPEKLPVSAEKQTTIEVELTDKAQMRLFYLK